MQKYVDDGKLAGITTLIARRGEVVHFESVGMAHVEADLPMRDDTIVRIYSMTKPITSVAVMMLYEHGKLRLTAPVSEYLPEFADLSVYDEADGAGVAPRRPMTVRDLLTHTSGLSYGWSDAPVDGRAWVSGPGRVWRAVRRVPQPRTVRATGDGGHPLSRASGQARPLRRQLRAG